MKFKSLIILIILGALMGFGLYWFIDRYEKERAEQDTTGRLAQGDLKLLEYIQIKNKHGTFKLTNDKNVWKVTSPITDLASQSEVKALVSGLQKFKEKKVVREAGTFKPGSKDLDQFGLRSPLLELTLKTSDQTKPIKVFVGKDNAASTGTYAYSDFENKLVLATKDIAPIIDKTVNSYVEMRLLTVNSGDFTEVNIFHKGKKTLLERDEKSGDWIMKEPYDVPLDQKFTKNVINKISLLRANSFIPKLPGKMRWPIEKRRETFDDVGLHTRIVVGFKPGVKDLRSDVSDKRPNGAAIIIGKVGSKYYAKGDKTRPASIAKFHYDNFEKGPEDFVLKTFDHLDIPNIEKITIWKKNETPIRVEKTETKGYRVTLEGKRQRWQPGKKEHIHSILSKLKELKATKFLGVEAPPSRYDVKMDLWSVARPYNTYVFKFGSNETTMWHSYGYGQTVKKLKYKIPSDVFIGQDFMFRMWRLPPKDREGVRDKLNPTGDIERLK